MVMSTTFLDFLRTGLRIDKAEWHPARFVNLMRLAWQVRRERNQLAQLSKEVELGFDPRTRNEFGRSALFESCLAERWDNARVLLEAGADPRDRDPEGQTDLETLEEFGVTVPAWLRDGTPGARGA